MAGSARSRCGLSDMSSANPPNHFKVALAEGRTQMGFWLALANADIAEICAGLGFDWLLVDAEHGPQTLPGIIEQLRAIASCPRRSEEHTSELQSLKHKSLAVFYLTTKKKDKQII